jgi:hypothetical protein
MKPGRRNFLHFAGLAPATALAGLAVQPAAQAASVPGSALTRTSFAPLVGQDFVFETSALEQVTAKLVKMETLANLGPAQDPEGAFRLVFETQAGALPQQTFPVTHPRLGRFAMFVHPNDAAGKFVEAVFNRL